MLLKVSKMVLTYRCSAGLTMNFYSSEETAKISNILKQTNYANLIFFFYIQVITQITLFQFFFRIYDRK